MTGTSPASGMRIPTRHQNLNLTEACIKPQLAHLLAEDKVSDDLVLQLQKGLIPIPFATGSPTIRP